MIVVRSEITAPALRWQGSVALADLDPDDLDEGDGFPPSPCCPNIDVLDGADADGKPVIEPPY